MSSQGDRTSYWLSAGENQNHGKSGGGGSSLLVIDPAARTQDLADRFAAGYLAARARRHYQIEATVLGRPSLELGDSVQLSGAPDDSINGRGYVRAIRHRYGAAVGFTTTLRLSVEQRS
jgi:phage protein D